MRQMLGDKHPLIPLHSHELSPFAPSFHVLTPLQRRSVITGCGLNLRQHVKKADVSAAKSKVLLPQVPLVHPGSVNNSEETWIRHSPIVVVLLWPLQNVNVC